MNHPERLLYPLVFADVALLSVGDDRLQVLLARRAASRRRGSGRCRAGS